MIDDYVCFQALKLAIIYYTKCSDEDWIDEEMDRFLLQAMEKEVKSE